MPCYYPVQGWRGRSLNPTGKRPVVFDRAQGFSDKPIDIPCGRCIGCRLERSRQWAIRCVHEASLHDDNCFITLTYAETGPSLCLEDWQKFMKKVRKKYQHKRIRFFHCGEYGETNGRPHFHACLFGHDYHDRVLEYTRDNIRHYNSPTLEEEWGKGRVEVGDVSFESAAYVARYIMKKITGPSAAEHYKGKRPEYITMSRRPGIGRGWYEKYKHEVFPEDFIVMRGMKMPVPRAYNRAFEAEHPDEYARIKARRADDPKDWYERSCFRLPQKEAYAQARLNLLKRGLDES